MQGWLCCGAASDPARLQGGVKAGVDPARVALEYFRLFGGGDVQRVDIPFGVVEIMTCLWVDAFDRAEHFGRKEDIVGVDHLEQAIDPGLMIDAGVKIDVLHQMLAQGRLAHHIRQPAITPPVIGHSAAAMGDDQAQVREISEQIAL